jgi:hypothetical protein
MCGGDFQVSEMKNVSFNIKTKVKYVKINVDVTYVYVGTCRSANIYISKSHPGAISTLHLKLISNPPFFQLDTAG